MKPAVIHHEALALDLVLRRLESRWLPEMPDESVHHGYWPLGSREFLDGLAVCRDALWTTSDESVGRKFIDVGCGLGTNLLLAYLSGWDSTGLELHEPYAEVARELMPDVEIVSGDAWGFERYAEFDVVYSYRLCVDDEKQDAMEALTMSRMRPGSIIFLGGRNSTVKLPGESLGSNCWRV